MAALEVLTTALEVNLPTDSRFDHDPLDPKSLAAHDANEYLAKDGLSN